MPIYEYYCENCHTIYNFFSLSTNPSKAPACPRCHRPDMEKRVSAFAVLRRQGEDVPDFMDEMDDERMEQALESLAGEMERVGDTDNPKTMAHFMRRLINMTGVEMGPKMEDILRKMDAGMDPEDLEDELGEIDEEDDDALGEFVKLKKKVRSLRERPRKDETLYFLEEQDSL